MKRKIAQLAALILGIAFLAAVFLFDWNSINYYEAYNTSTLHYVRARVETIHSETLELDGHDSSRYLGVQDITVRLLEGGQKGEQVRLSNYLTRVHNIQIRQGQTVVICADTPENAQPYYTVFNYDRTAPLVLLIAIFSAAVLLIGRGKGLRALLGVVYTLLTIILFTVQAIYHGFSPVAVTALTVLIAGGASLLLLNGFSRRTAAAVLSTLAGVCVTGLAFALFSGLLHLSGYNMDAAETLLTASDSTGLSLRWLLLAGVLISALGAVMDVAVSLAASLEELVLVNPNMGQKVLLRSGLNIGKDMIGTMSNTLILAYAGTALSTMLCLIAYGNQFTQLLSSDYLAIELSQGLCATLGVVLTVPAAAGVSCLLFVRRKNIAPSAFGKSGAKRRSNKDSIIER